jgi:hypothetical protein
MSTWQNVVFLFSSKQKVFNPDLWLLGMIIVMLLLLGCAHCKKRAWVRREPMVMDPAVVSSAWLELNPAASAAQQSNGTAVDGATVESPATVSRDRCTSQSQIMPKDDALLSPPDKSGDHSHLSATDTVFCLISVAAVLPHTQPFNPTPLLRLTVWAWSAAPFLLLLWIVYAARELWRCGAPRLRPLTLTTLVLAGAYLWVALMFEHTPAGDVGFLDLCVDWCGGPMNSFCYHEPRPPQPPAENASVTAASAVTFFRGRVFGDVPKPVARWVADGSAIEVDGRRVVLQMPGRRRVLLALRKGALDLANQTGWTVAEIHITPWGEQPMIAREAAALNAVAALLRSSYAELAAYGCSVFGKVVYWAAVTAPPSTYNEVYVDSGGTLGPASARGAPFGTRTTAASSPVLQLRMHDLC